MTFHYGSATWYDLCNGSNGAGSSYGCPCDDDEYHVAYSHLSQTSCFHDCTTGLSNLSYCQYVSMYSYCNSNSIQPQIRDCACFNGCGGSCTSCCGTSGNDCGGLSPLLVDLTTTSFQGLGYSLGTGVVSIGMFA